VLLPIGLLFRAVPFEFHGAPGAKNTDNQYLAQGPHGARRGLAEGSRLGTAVAGCNIVLWRNWRATVDEDGHYSFAVPL
jgi:hypothetical protein